MPRTKKTATTSFGSPGRIGHDASAFYSARLYEDQPQVEDGNYVENPIPSELMNTIIHGSSESMKALPDSSVHLMVTSPPYNVGKEYDADMTLGEFLGLLKKVWAEVHRVLVPGGRACINVANLGRKPYIPLHTYIIEDMNDLGFLMRGEVIWNKAASASSSTAWGSWQSASNPTLRDVHEYILVFSKGNFGRDKPESGREDKKDTISKEQFLEFTKSVWDFPTESARKIGHPAPFPMELPYRCIQLYTFLNETVLDPFMGSGQTALAACKAGRHYVGYELNEEYVNLARTRLEENMDSK
jgi:DNA modification methylase